MPEPIKAVNFPYANLLEQAELDADAAAGQPVIIVGNNTGFLANSFVIVGEAGTEAAELKQIQSVNADGKTITLTTNLAYKHYQFERVVRLFGNQIKVYRAPNVDGTQPAIGTYSLLTTLTIEADDMQSSYTDPTGGNGYWYLMTFSNSFSAEETDKTDAQPIRGGNYGHLTDVARVKKIAGLTSNRWIPAEDYQEAILDAENEVKTAVLAGGYTIPMDATIAPYLLKNLTARLAAGYILTTNPSIGSEAITKQGKDLIDDARLQLEKIRKGEQPLLDQNDNPLGQDGDDVGGMDAADMFDSNGNSTAAFHMNDKW